MIKVIDQGKYKKRDVIRVGGESWTVKKRSWFPDINGSYTYRIEKTQGETMIKAFDETLMHALDECEKRDGPDRMNSLVRFLNRRAVFFYLGLLSFFFLSVIGGIILWVLDYIVWEVANKPNTSDGLVGI